MVKRIGIRFNLDKEHDLRIWEFLQDLNLEQHKSINRFILMCIDGYINQFTTEQEQSEFIDKVIAAIRTELQQSAGINLLKILSQPMQTVQPSEEIKNSDEDEKSALDFVFGNDWCNN